MERRIQLVLVRRQVAEARLDEVVRQGLQAEAARPSCDGLLLGERRLLADEVLQRRHVHLGLQVLQGPLVLPERGDGQVHAHQRVDHWYDHRRRPGGAEGAHGARRHDLAGHLAVLLHGRGLEEPRRGHRQQHQGEEAQRLPVRWAHHPDRVEDLQDPLGDVHEPGRVRQDLAAGAAATGLHQVRLDGQGRSGHGVLPEHVEDAFGPLEGATGVQGVRQEYQLQIPDAWRDRSVHARGRGFVLPEGRRVRGQDHPRAPESRGGLLHEAVHGVDRRRRPRGLRPAAGQHVRRRLRRHQGPMQRRLEGRLPRVQGRRRVERVPRRGRAGAEGAGPPAVGHRRPGAGERGGLDAARGRGRGDAPGDGSPQLGGQRARARGAGRRRGPGAERHRVEEHRRRAGPHPAGQGDRRRRARQRERRQGLEGARPGEAAGRHRRREGRQASGRQAVGDRERGAGRGGDGAGQGRQGERHGVPR
mmetsp:Transcript_62943/g.192560  ORF Transcript_62943/g.192560 Transcript_62943/m.192560 type:complete len:474 (+) Transcript_62943:520-1941(+)